MSAKKTALQEMIAYLENEIASYSGHDLAPAAVRGALSYAKEHAQQLLPTERQQMKDAWVESADKISREMFNEPMMYHEQMECNDYFENYFNETYETP